MSRSLIALAMVLAVVPAATASQQANSTKRQMTFHGCVMPGADTGTYVMTDVMAVPGPSGATMPEVAHGRRVLFWLHNDDAVKKHIGHMVEVRGEFRDLEKSEIELKAGAAAARRTHRRVRGTRERREGIKRHRWRGGWNRGSHRSGKERRADLSRAHQRGRREGGWGM